MSVKISARVWEHSSQSGSDLLVLLALADHADDSGICWPGVERVSYKARIQIRQTKRVIKKLARSGELFIEYQHGHGGGRGHTNRYFIVTGLSAYEIEDILKQRFEIPPEEARQMADKLIDTQNGGSFTERVSSRGQKGVIQDTLKRVSSKVKRVSSKVKKGVIATTPEPSITVKETSIETSVVVTATDELSEIYQIYQNEIGGISPIIAQEIEDLSRTCAVEWFRLAMAKAARANVRRWSYVKAILKSWETSGGPQNDKPKKNGAVNNDNSNHTKITGLRYGNSIKKRVDLTSGRTYWWDSKRQCEVPEPDVS